QQTAATTLGYTTTHQLDPDRALNDIGFDSLTAVQLRNRLATQTGLRLPATLIFDHPTPASLARYLHGELVPDVDAGAALLAELDSLEASFADLSPDGETHRQVLVRLQSLVDQWRGRSGAAEEQEELDLDSATDDEMFRLIDSEFGPA
ncbi:hypothetical protein ACM01_45505, partial [Streptomyces viridochromogenes]